MPHINLAPLTLVAVLLPLPQCLLIQINKAVEIDLSTFCRKIRQVAE
jgi:hypothetical protein